MLHSLTKEFAYVAQSLLQDKIDVFAITESWHLASDDVPILRATPSGFSSRDCPRPPRPDGRQEHGGGIVVFFRSSLRVSQVTLDELLLTQ